VELISILALPLVALAGYSAGAVFSGRGKAVAPRAVDLVAVVAVWAFALVSRGLLGRWPAIAAGAAAGALVGGILTAVRRPRYPALYRRTSGRDTGALRRAWEAWGRFAAAMGSYQTRVWLGLLFLTAFAPFALLARLSGDRLRLRPPLKGSVWSDWGRADRELDYGERQF
jgi:hypothetical protein